jgi:hypothetical protein
MDMHLSLESFSPTKASKILNNHNNLNRKLRPGLAEKYAHDMKSGTWTECVAPIVFYDDGELADGQHRLFAIVESGTTQKFFVRRGLPREAGLNIDTGLTRTLVDNAKIAGHDLQLSNELLSVTRAIEDGERSLYVVAGKRRAPRTNAERLEIVDKHAEAAAWAISHGPRGRLLHNAAVLAAIGRAWYWEKDKEMLARFSEVVSSGFADGEKESAAVAIRNYLMTTPNCIGSAAGWRDTFLKVQNAIHYFMRGRKLHVIKGVKSDAYPLKPAHYDRKAA